MSADINLADGLMWFFVFLYSTILHEAGHAWAAHKLGDSTAYLGGQVSLDPTPHVRREPFGMIVVPLLSYFTMGWMVGWASAPFDPAWARQYPRRDAWMSLAGPAANLALLLAAALCMRIGAEWGVFTPTYDRSFTHIVDGEGGRIWELCARLLSIGFFLNLLLFTFNLLPLPPLDGSSVPLLFLSANAAEKYQEFMWNPGMRFFGIIVAWQIFGRLFTPIEHFARDLLYAALRF